MGKRQKRAQSREPHIVHSFVYAYRLFSVILLLVICIQPVAPVFADELQSSDPATDISTESSQNPSDDALVDTESAIDVAPSPEASEDSSVELRDHVLPTSNAEVETAVADTVIESSVDAPSLPPGIDINNSAVEQEPVTNDMPLQETESAENVPGGTIEDPTQNENVASTTTSDEIPPAPTSTPVEIVIEDEVITPIPNEPAQEPESLQPTSTDPAVVEEDVQPEGVPIEVNTVTNNDNAFTFSKNECVSVGDGSFYCSAAATAPKVVGTDRVFSAVDGDGDREIFVEREGELVQITTNELDDDAPFYDKLSDTIVWHRLVDERYQIIVYDVQAGEEQQRTNERYNNMEPSRYGNTIVWQGWIGNDWEIMLEESGELLMLTDNTSHDISPRINGNYIVWQAFENEVWHVKVYDMTTKQIDTIENAEGASIDNPRFVLVYDAKQNNGDIETKGYDLESGEVVPLDSKPLPVPESIPDPDQTGENRALPQQNTQVKPKQETSTGPEPEPIPEFDSEDEQSATTTESDLIVPAHEDTPELVTEPANTAIAQPDPTLQAFDLEIPAFDTSNATTGHIEDIVITPFVEPIIDDTDSQAIVAPTP